MQYIDLRNEIISTVRSYRDNGLGVGTSGNLSARTEQGFLITPTGIPYEELQAEDVVELDTSGEIISGSLTPSSEWRFHADIYSSRTEVGSVVHTHSSYATAISCTRQGIPAFHYMVAKSEGNSIRCADYATFGTEQLSINALQALAGRNACLLSNHGVITLGEDIKSAFNLAIEIEEIAKQYLLSSMAGKPVLLDENEMQVNLDKFRNYGKQI